jgi:hypothetical protein
MTTDKKIARRKLSLLELAAAVHASHFSALAPR